MVRFEQISPANLKGILQGKQAVLRKYYYKKKYIDTVLIRTLCACLKVTYVIVNK